MAVGTLNWSLPEAIAQLGTLPVRLLGEDGRIEAEGLSGRDLEVVPGRYYLACILPNGREIVRRNPIEIKAGARIDPAFPFLEFDLGPSESAAQGEQAAPAQGSFSLLGLVQGLVVRLMGGQFNLVSAAPDEIHFHEVNWMDQPDILNRPTLEPSPTGAPYAGILSNRGVLELSRPLESGTDRLIQVDGTDATHFFVVPLDWPIGSGQEPSIQIELRDGQSGREPHFTSRVSAEANAYVEFVNNGLLSQSCTLGADLLDLSHQALRESGTSALKAVLSGYVLLRVNALDDIERRIGRLAEIVDQVPDVRAIQAETLSRLGKHEEALVALRQALRMGCPWFRSGVGYLLERLRLYVEVDAEQSAAFDLSVNDRALFVERRAYFEALGRRLNTASLFTAFVYPRAETGRARVLEGMAAAPAVAASEG